MSAQIKPKKWMIISGDPLLNVTYLSGNFIISVVFLILAIILFIIEAQHSHYALTLHIKDLEEYSENKIKSLIRKEQL